MADVIFVRNDATVDVSDNSVALGVMIALACAAVLLMVMLGVVLQQAAEHAAVVDGGNHEWASPSRVRNESSEESDEEDEEDEEEEEEDEEDE